MVYQYQHQYSSYLHFEAFVFLFGLRSILFVVKLKVKIFFVNDLGKIRQ